MDSEDGVTAPGTGTMNDPRVDASMPVRDHGSFLCQPPSFADIQDHRNQNTVYIGLHLPRQNRRRRHHRHRPKRALGSRDELSGLDCSTVVPPSLRVQVLLGEDEDEDHKSHDVFCEMAELFPSTEDPTIKEWKETARWVKFEEDVEEGGERWSKPHVATLSLHSIFQLRCTLLQGTTMLDLNACSLDQVIDMVLDNMVAGKQLEPTMRDQVRDTLMARHRHQNEKRVRHKEESRIHLPFVRSLADIGRKSSEPKRLDNHGEERVTAKSTPNMATLRRIATSPNTQHVPNGVANGGAVHENGLHEVPSHKNLHFMKKIPPDSEASNIFVGEVDFLKHQITAFIRLSKATVLGDITEVPVPTRFIYFLLGPIGNQNKYHEIGRSMATLMTDEVFHDVAYHAHSRDDLLSGIDEFLDQVTVLPPGEWDPSIRIEPPKSVPSQENRKTASSSPPHPNGNAVTFDTAEEHADPSLMRTGRLFGGLREDVKRKWPFVLSDFKDAMHLQCLASFVFLYFACLTPIITFGGLLGDATNNNMAALESMFSGAICGIIYSLFAGQPLTILGSTGPVLVFETILNQFCVSKDLDYLEMRLWIGIWTGLLLVVIVAFDLSAMVRYITRFTEESFAALISLIFIYEAFRKLLSIADDYPMKPPMDDVFVSNCSCNLSGLIVDASNTTDVIDEDYCTLLNGTLVGEGCDPPVYQGIFFFSVLLFLGTFTLCYFLKVFRNTPFCRTVVRSVVSDFAVLLAILIMVTVDVLVGIPTPKLHVPDSFTPTNPERGWLIVPFQKNPNWTPVGCIMPALLAVILIFMDQQITAVIVNRKENKLMKGCGYHLDLFIVAVLIIICSILGLPWFVAATVLSINHVSSLKKESECSAPGEQPKFLGVREQRVTGITIFLFIGISVTMTSVLRVIPMPVLYGVFLYMGVSSLRGMQLMDRIAIAFMPAKYQPDFLYLRHVPVRRVHLFTFIQVFCLAALCAIKMIKEASIAFPLMVLAMCFVRFGLNKVFTQNELKWLDDIMPESFKRAKEDENVQNEEGEEEGGVAGEDVQVVVAGQQLESITIAANLDQVNISEEVSRSALWKSIVHNESSTCFKNCMDETHSALKQRKYRKHSKKHRETNGIDRTSSSPAIIEMEEPKESVVHRKKKPPVHFYIDEEHEEEHKVKVHFSNDEQEQQKERENFHTAEHEEPKVNFYTNGHEEQKENSTTALPPVTYSLNSLSSGGSSSAEKGDADTQMMDA
ncbi:sodium-driven chloride bicarbonate exchanger-like isoform X2 [Babylonia areolata]|uniref:sodium-driven chloride bicarbonate exchanger-like isoform X2 n=1 Tax=Babylonia areolata TaxID=304850 RepID=UPI003FD085B4